MFSILWGNISLYAFFSWLSWLSARYIYRFDRCYITYSHRTKKLKHREHRHYRMTSSALQNDVIGIAVWRHRHYRMTSSALQNDVDKKLKSLTLEDFKQVNHYKKYVYLEHIVSDPGRFDIWWRWGVGVDGMVCSGRRFFSYYICMIRVRHIEGTFLEKYIKVNFILWI